MTTTNTQGICQLHATFHETKKATAQTYSERSEFAGQPLCAECASSENAYAYAPGDGVTFSIGGDAYAYEVVTVYDGTVAVRRLRATVASGDDSDGSATYSYAPDPSGAIKVLTRRRNGRWVEVGSLADASGRWSIGSAHERRDPSF